MDGHERGPGRKGINKREDDGKGKLVPDEQSMDGRRERHTKSKGNVSDERL